MTKLKKKVHQISSNNGSGDMKHSHHSQCSTYFKGDAFLGWMCLELQSEGLLPGGFTDQGTTAISSPRGPQSFAKTGLCQGSKATRLLRPGAGPVLTAH